MSFTAAALVYVSSTSGAHALPVQEAQARPQAPQFAGLLSTTVHVPAQHSPTEHSEPSPAAAHSAPPEVDAMEVEDVDVEDVLAAIEVVVPVEPLPPPLVLTRSLPHPGLATASKGRVKTFAVRVGLAMCRRLSGRVGAQTWKWTGLAVRHAARKIIFARLQRLGRSRSRSISAQ